MVSWHGGKTFRWTYFIIVLKPHCFPFAHRAVSAFLFHGVSSMGLMLFNELLFTVVQCYSVLRSFPRAQNPERALDFLVAPKPTRGVLALFFRLS